MNSKIRQSLMVLCSIVCVGYLIYRGLYTLNLSSPYAVVASWLLYAAEIWGTVSMLLFLIQVWDPTEPADQPPLEDAEIDVFVPSYNEDVSILRGTLQACLAMDYPHRTFLLDDGNREEMKILCEELGVHYITRDNNLHAKAGNLNNAFDQTDGEFVAILDADHIPEPNFLSKMVGHFRDENVGMVQSPHAFSNFDTFQGRVNYEKGRFWDEGLLFYKVIQPGRNATDSVIFAGSAALFRRKALQEVGYIATETITEDMHTGIRMSACGWKTVYVSERLIAGQGASDVTTYHSQRLRWAEGNLTILRHDNPLTTRGLNLTQRLTYFASIIHWAGGLPRLVLYITPMLMLLSGVAPVAEITPMLVTVFVTYIGAMMITLRVIYRGYTNYDLIEFFNMANFWTQMRSTGRAVFTRKKAKFVVTHKGGGRHGSILPHIMPQVILLAALWMSLAFGWIRHLLFDPQLDLVGLGIATFLVLHHSRYAVAYLRCAMAPASKRDTYRHRLNLPVQYSFKNNDGVSFDGVGVTTDLCDTGVGIVAYSSLPTNVHGTIEVMVNGDRMKAEAIIRYAAHRKGEAHRGADEPQLYRYGLEFIDVSPDALDAAGRIAQRYAVAPWYSVFERNRTSGVRVRAHLSDRVVAREDFKLPVLMHADGKEVHCTTRDLSIRSMRCIMAMDIAEGDVFDTEIISPIGTIHVKARATALRTVTGPPHSISEYVFNFDGFEDQGRSLLQSLLDLGAHPELRSTLSLSHERPRKPMSRPVLAGALALAVFSPVAIGVFRQVHDDDLLLAGTREEVALRMETVKAEDIDRIFAETLADETPDKRRLLLLKDVLEEAGRYPELVRVCRILSSSDSSDPDMGMALASALTLSGRYREAEDICQHWIKRITSDSMDPRALLTFQVLQARNTLASGDAFAALDRFRRILALFPDEVVTRKEYAGLLLQVGLPEEALRQYASIPQDMEVRLELVSIHSALGDFVSAEKLIRDILQENPSERSTQVRLAEILTWQKRFDESERIYRELLAQNPYDLESRIALAETMTWAGESDQSLVEYGHMIDEGSEDWRLLAGFLDAFLGATVRSESDTRRLMWMVSLYNRAEDPPVEEIAGRLATALTLVGEYESSLAMLQTAVKTNPDNKNLRMRLADALSSAGLHKEAQHHYRALLSQARESGRSSSKRY